MHFDPVNGGVAQLGEHLPCKQGVRGSNPLISNTADERSEAVDCTLKTSYRNILSNQDKMKC